MVAGEVFSTRLDTLCMMYVSHSLFSFERQLCTFAWVLALLGILFSLLLTKKTTMITVLCRHVHSDWCRTEAFLNVIGKSLTLKENTISNSFTIYIYIAEIPTNKRAKFYKLKISKIGNKNIMNKQDNTTQLWNSFIQFL